MRAIQISAFGKLTEVLKLVDIPEPAAPASGEALIGVEFAPINHNDLLLIREHFTTPRHFRMVVGNEGVGRILAVGPDVTNVKVGDRVLLPLYSNTWRERIVVPVRGSASC
jgi:NADPH:quinone reductase-like Zn-dependent oxidoreductase